MCPTVVHAVMHHCWGLDGFCYFLFLVASAPLAANLNSIVVVESLLSALRLSGWSGCILSGLLVWRLCEGRLGYTSMVQL